MSNQMTNINLSLFVQNKGEQSSKLALMLTRAKKRTVVRITGGCGFMSAEDAIQLNELFVEAFAGFSGAMLFGGTRMLNHLSHKVVPGITEVAPLIRRVNPDCVILGVVPKTDDMRLDLNVGLILREERQQGYITIVHPEQDSCLVVQQSVDQTSPWEAEYLECLNIVENLRNFADWQSLLICYNGGGVTEKELLNTTERGWPVLLIKGSGRITDQYALDQVFLEKYPNVVVAEREVSSIRNSLQKLSVLEREVVEVGSLKRTDLLLVNGGKR